jgi:hypothetical protein
MDRLCFGGHCVNDPSAPVVVGNGACTNPADEHVVRNGVNLHDLAQQCGLMCLGQMQPCIDACVAGATGFSAGCAACWGATVSCANSLCVFPCSLSDDAQDCDDCRDSLCNDFYEGCAGLAAPSWH